MRAAWELFSVMVSHHDFSSLGQWWFCRGQTRTALSSHQLSSSTARRQLWSREDDDTRALPCNLFQDRHPLHPQGSPYHNITSLQALHAHGQEGDRLLAQTRLFCGLMCCSAHDNLASLFGLGGDFRKVTLCFDSLPLHNWEQGQEPGW